MKIKFSSIVLNKNGESPRNFCIETKRQSQTEFPIDAEKAKIFDRKNVRTNIVFSLERSHESEEAATFFAISHANVLENLTPADLDLSWSNGENVSTLTNAIPTKIRIETNGLVTLTRYEFSAE